MDSWSGTLRLDDSNEIRDIHISAPSTKPPIPSDCTLRFLSHVDTTRIPLQLVCGPRLDVWTADADTETWFSNLLLSSSDTEDQGREWWQSAALESPLGILAAVHVADTSNIPQPRITEILFYAARKDIQQDPPTLPPHNEASSSGPQLGLYALALSSDLLLFNDTVITPPTSPILGASSDTSTITARFIPHPWDEPTARQKRKLALNSTFTAASEQRKRHSGASVAAAAASTSSSSIPPLPRLKSEASRGAVPILTRPKSRSPSIATLRREPTLPERRVSSLSRSTPVPVTAVTAEEEALEKKNKDMVSKVVLAGLRVWGFTASSSASRRKNRAASTSLISTTESQDPDHHHEAKDEEYKLLYHHVYKGACFALRSRIGKQDLRGREYADKVRDVVDSLLAIFCKDPMEVVGRGEDVVVDLGEGFKGAVVRTPKGELGEEERGLR
ncbi:hypothetical protein E4T39_00088 [Aureobasidium subglaciale]|nr:hypothetical protein E4T39_00088 [Aureobasidium subglaciale]